MTYDLMTLLRFYLGFNTQALSERSFIRGSLCGFGTVSKGYWMHLGLPAVGTACIWI